MPITGQSAGDAVWVLRASTDGLKQDLAKGVGQVEAATKKAGLSIKQMGIAATVAGGAITAAMGLSIRSAMAYRNEISNVATLGVKDLGALSSAVKDVAATYGQDLKTGAQAAYQAISAGASEADAPKILESAARAATAGVSDMKTAIELGMGTMNAFSGSVKSVDEVFDSAFTAVKMGVTTFGELAASTGKLSPIFAGVGLSMDEMHASIAALTKGGISTSEAVTGMKAVMAGIINPTAQAAEKAKELGIEFNAAALQSKGLEGFLKDVGEAVNGNVAELSKLFSSSEAFTAVLALTGAQAGSLTEILAAMGDKAFASQEAFDEFAKDNPEFAFKLLKAQVSVLATNLGESLLPALKRVLDFVSPIIKALAGWTQKHPTLTAVIAGTTVALGGILLIGGLVALSIKTLSAAMVTLGLSSGTAAVGGVASATQSVAAMGTAANLASGSTAAFALQFVAGAGLIAIAGLSIAAVVKEYYRLREAQDGLRESNAQFDSSILRLIETLREQGVAIDEAALKEMTAEEQRKYLLELHKQNLDQRVADTSAAVNQEEEIYTAYYDREYANMTAREQRRADTQRAMGVLREKYTQEFYDTNTALAIQNADEIENIEIESNAARMKSWDEMAQTISGSIETSTEISKSSIKDLATALNMSTEEISGLLDRLNLDHSESPSINDRVRDSFANYLGMLGGFGDTISGVLGGIRDVWLNTWGQIFDYVSGSIKKILPMISDVGGIGGAIGGMGGAIGGMMPAFAIGGSMPYSGMAVLGEPKNTPVQPIAPSGRLAGGGGINVGDVSVILNGSNLSPQEVGRIVRTEFADHIVRELRARGINT